MPDTRVWGQLHEQCRHTQFCTGMGTHKQTKAQTKGSLTQLTDWGINSMMKLYTPPAPSSADRVRRGLAHTHTHTQATHTQHTHTSAHLHKHTQTHLCAQTHNHRRAHKHARNYTQHTFFCVFTHRHTSAHTVLIHTHSRDSLARDQPSGFLLVVFVAKTN